MIDGSSEMEAKPRIIPTEFYDFQDKDPKNARLVVQKQKGAEFARSSIDGVMPEYEILKSAGELLYEHPENLKLAQILIAGFARTFAPMEALRTKTGTTGPEIDSRAFDVYEDLLNKLISQG